MFKFCKNPKYTPAVPTVEVSAPLTTVAVQLSNQRQLTRVDKTTAVEGTEQRFMPTVLNIGNPARSFLKVVTAGSQTGNSNASGGSSSSSKLDENFSTLK